VRATPPQPNRRKSSWLVGSRAAQRPCAASVGWRARARLDGSGAHRPVRRGAAHGAASDRRIYLGQADAGACATGRVHRAATRCAASHMTCAWQVTHNAANSLVRAGAAKLGWECDTCPQARWHTPCDGLASCNAQRHLPRSTHRARVAPSAKLVPHDTSPPAHRQANKSHEASAHEPCGAQNFTPRRSALHRGAATLQRTGRSCGY
jgi:hypothetical protein